VFSPRWGLRSGTRIWFSADGITWYLRAFVAARYVEGHWPALRSCY
jgi:hypothetical protein